MKPDLSPISSRGQATLEYLLTFLILLSILLFLALPTNRLYANSLQLYKQTSEAQSLALTSLDLGMLHCAGPQLTGFPPLPPYKAGGMRILSSTVNSTSAPGVTAVYYAYEVLNVTHT